MTSPPPPADNAAEPTPISAEPTRPDGRPPSVDQLARTLDPALPHPLRVDAARAAIKTVMSDATNRQLPATAIDALVLEAGATAIARLQRRQLMPVLNGTGVLLHTNLGRAPLEHSQAATYQNLELDLETGGRGSRQAAVGSLLAAASGAEAAMVVNNCSGALLLALAALGAGKGVSVSRGELVEIGGGFRVPDVMAQSGAKLIEVGTTNRTRLSDYERAAEQEEVALSLHVHRSNYTIEGFTESVSIEAMASLDAPVIADIGSGLLDKACPWLEGPPPAWLDDEPAAKQTLEAGAALAIFSGDKLLGGPQAGIIAGRKDFVDRCSKHPLARALRPGGLVLAALQHTTMAYLRRDGDAIPFWRMVALSPESLRARGEAIVKTLAAAGGEANVKVAEVLGVPGGGTLPGVTIPSVGLRIERDLVDALRSGPQPLIARVEDDHTIIDLRTIDPGDDEIVAQLLATALGSVAS